MVGDKFSAVWVSHSSIGDFKKCPRAYYLKNVYKDPKTNHKIQIMSPALALGQAVHTVLESLSIIPTDLRFKDSLIDKFQDSWQKVSGLAGGFHDPESEQRFKLRGEEMLRRVMRVKGPIARLSVKIKQELPHYWLSEEDNIILCGKVDWLEYLPETDSVHIIDFKTGKSEEDADSLQLPIYHLLVKNCQHRSATKASYWYIDMSDDLQEKVLPDLDEAEEKVLQFAKKMKLARQLNLMKCPKGDDGCRDCLPFEKILRGQMQFVGVNDRRDMYIFPQQVDAIEMESEIL